MKYTLKLLLMASRCFLFALMAFFIYNLLIFMVRFLPIPAVHITSINRSSRRETNKSRLIVDWTTIFGTPIEEIDMSMAECSAKCTFTSNQSQVVHADAVLFHIRDFKHYRIPLIRHPYQRYIFFLMESPLNSGGSVKNIPKNFFNMTLTYRLDSDVIANYDWMISKQTVKFLIDPPLVYSWDQVLSAVSQKTKLVAELVSNCYTDSKREEYSAELSQFIPVDSYGSCSGIVCEDCNKMLADDYLFYLAFENSVCRDYVTEKVWRMKKLIVPIVLRKSDYINIVPEGSFIAIDQFRSSKDLANYLRYLSVNRTEYLKYFEWTKHFLASSVQNYGYFCELCKTISDDVLPPKVYENIEKWWVEGGNCRVDFAEQFVSNHGASEKRKLFILLLIVVVALFMTFHARRITKATEIV